MENLDIAEHEEWFEMFAQNYIRLEEVYHGETGPLILKLQHTHAVLNHARRLALEYSFDADATRATMLAALYHDLARFPQFMQWRTFVDKQSTNHALFAVRLLKAHERLDAENKKVRTLTLAAIAMHNRFAVPQRLPTVCMNVTKAVRDADKVDILRIMAENLDPNCPHDKTVVLAVRDEPSAYTPKILEDVFAGRLASYADLQYVNDFRLLLGTWLHELHFPLSMQAVAASGSLCTVLDGLPDIAVLQEAREYILKVLCAAQPTDSVAACRSL